MIQNWIKLWKFYSTDAILKMARWKPLKVAGLDFLGSITPRFERLLRQY